MKIRHINFLLVGALILLTISLAITVVWGLQQLSLTATATERYYQLSSKVNKDIFTAIEGYLLSGDSLQLSQAESLVDSLIQHDLPALNKNLRAELLPNARQLQQRLSTDLRAVGKLSGNEAVILEQAESSMLATLSSLADYAAQAQADTDRAEYLELLGRMSRDVAGLSYYRVKLFNLEPGLADNISSQLKRLLDLQQQLSLLPSLAIYVEDSSDEMEALLWGDDDNAQPAEEQGDLLKQELHSLLKRYPQELQRSQKLLTAAQQARNSVKQQLAVLQQQLATLETMVLTQRNSIERQVHTVMLLVSVAMIVLALLVFIFQHWLAGLLSAVNKDIAALAQGDFRPRKINSSRIKELAGLLLSLIHI